MTRSCHRHRSRHGASTRSRGRAPDERGAALVLFTIVMVVLIAVAALVIDVAQLRQDRRADTVAADFAATAAAAVLGVNGAGAQAACNEAWSVVLANLDDAQPVTTQLPCSGFTGSCSSTSTAHSATGVAGPYTVTFTHPVPDGSSLLNSSVGSTQGVVSSIDGTQCERVAVRIVRTRNHGLGRVLGLRSGSTAARAVARGYQGTPISEIVTLLLLERTGCDALRVEGQAQVIADASSADTSGHQSPGYIVADSDGSTCSGGFVIDATGTATRIQANSSPSGDPGRILLRAMPITTSTCATPWCDPNDVSGGRVSPQPQGWPRRIGRDPVDHQYNCKTSYTMTAPWTGLVLPCTGTPAPHIDNLVAANNLGPGVAPTGFNTYPFPGSPGCDIASSIPAFTLVGNWYFNCPAGLTVRTSLTITGNAVFESSVTVTSGTGRLTMGGSGTPTFAFLRNNGSLVKQGQGSLTLTEVMLYINNGGIDLAAGTGTLNWVSPLSGSFKGLALWSESSGTHHMAGQATTIVEGIFFTPRAGYGGSTAFQVVGSSGDFQTRAQFITWKLLVQGQGQIHLRPRPDLAIPVDHIYQQRLIR